ncbi:MAG TPA: hypothetical protein PK646_04955 [Bacillota bacterium]|jgi:hypothetical protein|nr:hypothetical protein [Fastidiosipila sp.]HPX93675.1 hypothetical protein [Bacillota bacterium]HQB81421.1 hypothetical protein [Bacillota bacterium]
MAFKEGRCINCGSLLFLDPDTPKGHCLFCDCVFDSEEAFKALENPELFTFPNEKQPEYQGPPIAAGRPRRGSAVTAQPAAPVTAEKKEDGYQLPESKVPSLKIPVKVIVLYSALTVAVLGILSAVAFPLIAKRNHRQAAITDSFVSKLSYTLDKEKDIRVQGMTGTDVVLILPEDVSARESIELFDLYCQVRAEVVDLKDTSFESSKRPVTLRIATPGGGFLIDRPADQAALNPDALTHLD